MMAELAEAAQSYHAELIARLGVGAQDFLVGLDDLGRDRETQRHAGQSGEEQGQ
jgi:hypothetical protein